RDIAKLLDQAAAEGRDVDHLLTRAVTMRDFEDDPASPARQVAGVLHHRIGQLLASPPAETRPADLPADVAGLVGNASAPAGHGPSAGDQHAQPDAAHETPPPFRRNGRPPEGRDSR
ncbi:MAG: hypothetical protein J2P30_15565, partial [Actinobacteria bacterium]|nr:hypothetical protein [Actinomycetota bacterium]